MRDLWIKGNDLIVATHGRSFWILDDIAPLRQLATVRQRPRGCSSSRATLSRPAQHQHRYAASRPMSPLAKIRLMAR